MINRVQVHQPCATSNLLLGIQYLLHKSKALCCCYICLSPVNVILSSETGLVVIGSRRERKGEHLSLSLLLHRHLLHKLDIYIISSQENYIQLG